MPDTRSQTSIDEVVQASEKRLADLIKSSKTELQDSIQEVRSDISDINLKVNSIEHDVHVHSDEITKLRQELTESRNAYDRLEKQVIMKDMHDRKPNLLFYGIKEYPKENTEHVLRDYFTEVLKFDHSRVQQMRFKVVHRLPVSEYQRKHRPDAHKSIIATFSFMSDREDVFNARKLLRGTGKSIQTDLPAMLKKRRAILSRLGAEIREKEHLWTRVRVVGTEVILETKDPKAIPSTWTKHS